MGRRNMRKHGAVTTLVLFACIGILFVSMDVGALRCMAGEDPPVEGALPVPSQEKVGLRYACGFTVEHQDTFKKIQVLSPWRDARVSFTYILVERGKRGPSVPPDSMVVEIPLQRVALVSTTQVPFFAMLGLESSIAGIARGRFVNSPPVAERIRQGLIQEIGVGDSGMVRNLNMERLFALQPDAVIVYGINDPEYHLQPKLAEAGFPVIVEASYMEPTPLGRAEWIKFVAAFFNRESYADRIFEDIARRYEFLAEQTRERVIHRPAVFHGMAHRNVWFMPGGESYAARLYADAGGDYIWKDDSSRGNMPLSMESVVERARDADYWVDVGPCGSLAELKGSDERYGLFRAFRQGNVYNNDAKIGPGGGNDYWETGVARPDLVLADLVSIFHPSILPSHERIWYRKLPDQGVMRP